MNLALAVLIIVLATGVAVGAMLAVRRRPPEGSYFADGDLLPAGSECWLPVSSLCSPDRLPGLHQL
jgi:hypothetical protein